MADAHFPARIQGLKVRLVLRLFLLKLGIRWEACAILEESAHIFFSYIFDK